MAMPEEPYTQPQSRLQEIALFASDDPVLLPRN